MKDTELETREMYFKMDELPNFHYPGLVVFYNGKLILGIKELKLVLYKHVDNTIGNEELIHDSEKALVDLI